MDRFETFATDILLINRYVQKIKEEEMKALGLKGKHTMCLYHLGQHPDGLTATQLCQICCEDKAAVSRTLKELCGRGYVRMAGGSAARAYRCKTLLTEQGKQLIHHMNQRVEHVLNTVSDGLDAARRKVFYEALDLVTQNLRQYIGGEGEVQPCKE